MPKMFNPIIFIHMTPEGTIDKLQVHDEGVDYFPVLTAPDIYREPLTDTEFRISLIEGIIPELYINGEQLTPTDASIVNGDTFRFVYNFTKAPTQPALSIVASDGLVVGDRMG